MRWPNLTLLDLWCVLYLARKLSQAAKVMPPIVPGRDWAA